jgi:hypothetical protein
MARSIRGNKTNPKNASTQPKLRSKYIAAKYAVVTNTKMDQSFVMAQIVAVICS